MNDNDQLDEMPGANMNTRDVHQHLKKRGWSLSRSSGGHDVYTHAKSDKHIAVPRHKQLKAPLVMGILKTAKMVSEENDTMEKNEMAQTQLHFIEYASKEILDYISMGGEIEEWYQNKLSKVHSDMEGLHSYIEGEKRRTGMKVESRENTNDPWKQKYFGPGVEHPAKHKVSVTVSDPNHSTVSKRTEKVEKKATIKAMGGNKAAMEIAKKHYEKKGYKVHDVNYIHEEITQVDEGDNKQIDELSKSTLGSYAKRASYDSVTRGMKYGEKMNQSGSNKKELNKLNKRESGVQNAIDRLAKKSVNEKENDQMKGGKDVPNCVPVKENFEQLEEGRPSQRHPLEDHEYHRKSNDELIRIAKDAHKAAEAMKSHNTTAENKYRDQANDSATVRYFRQKNGMPTWYKKKYGHMNESMDITNESDAAWEKAKEKEKRDALTNKDRGTLDKVRAMMAKEKKPVQEQHSLDEISKRTLGSYIKKANDESRYEANRSGYVAGKSTKPYNDSEESSLEKKRASGITKAIGRLTKEDHDQLQEGGYKRMATDAEEDKRLSPGTVTDKSGAVHTPMSRVKHIAQMAMKRQSQSLKSVKEEKEDSRKAGIVKDLVKTAKKRKTDSSDGEKFESDPIMSSEIQKQ